jgi:hypothetical protein
MLALGVRTPARAAALLSLLTASVVLIPMQAYSDQASYDWGDDAAAVDSATRIVQECLDEHEQGGKYLDRYSCILRPSEICGLQYDAGRQSQRDLARCAGFAAEAWERILEVVYNRLVNSGSAPKRVEESQSTWKAWSDLDCRMVADYIGTQSELDFAACKRKHAAERVFDLLEINPR